MTFADWLQQLYGFSEGYFNNLPPGDQKPIIQVWGDWLLACPTCGDPTNHMQPCQRCSQPVNEAAVIYGYCHTCYSALDEREAYYLMLQYYRGDIELPPFEEADDE